jgi:predicted metalloprotease
MQLGDQRASGNIEDRRGIGVGGGLGIGGIVVAVIAYFLGFDPSTVINVAEQVGTQRETREAPRGVPADEAGQFVAKVLGSTEDVWTRIFQQNNAKYRPPTLVLYDRQVRSGCGVAQSAMGPFYCPNDEKLYIDLSFFRVSTLRATLRRRT